MGPLFALRRLRPASDHIRLTVNLHPMLQRFINIPCCRDLSMLKLQIRSLLPKQFPWNFPTDINRIQFALNSTGRQIENCISEEIYRWISRLNFNLHLPVWY